MVVLDCGHSATEEPRLLCEHLLGQLEPDYHEYFTGEGTTIGYICELCAQDLLNVENHLREVCPACFEQVYQEGYCDDIVGIPEVKERKTDLYFHHESLTISGIDSREILDMKPATHEDRNLWLAVTKDEEIVQLELDHFSMKVLVELPESSVDYSQQVALHLSPNADVAAVVNRRGEHGFVVDLPSGEMTMQVDRGQYYPEHSDFPIAFFEREQRLFIVFGNNWNVLHISDAHTGQLMTERSWDDLDIEGKPRHLGIFHGELLISPDQETIVGDGWMWHPMGTVRAWKLSPWLNDNPWECDENGSRVHLYERDGTGGGPFCWLDSRRLIAWGYGENHVQHPIPAARIFDVTTGKEEKWFPGPSAGPNGKLVFDDYLFSFDVEEGMAVWDIDTEEQLHHEFGFCPSYYHPGIQAFLTRDEKGGFQISRLLGKPIDADWLTRNSGTVRKIAETILTEKSFEDLPILADALEEAGCEETAILDHCRAGESHGNHCWVVDLLLYGKGESQ